MTPARGDCFAAVAMTAFEIGHRAAIDKVEIHDLHATILHLLGLDHKKLTFKHSGRRFRLTDVAGRVIDQIIA